ncbi:MAG: hypothetical protein AAGD04_13505 [Pseudomonadota bacterium]
MDVNLQVVGIFYNSTVSVTAADPTIKDLLDAATATPGTASDRNPASKFLYTTNGAGKKLFASSFLAKYDNPVKPRVLNQAPYAPGEYFLDEHLSARPAYTVWQYYMFDKELRYLNEFGKATPFAEQPLTNVPVAGNPKEKADVARVTWRLVQILAQPTTPATGGYDSEMLLAQSTPYTMRG